MRLHEVTETAGKQHVRQVLGHFELVKATATTISSSSFAEVFPSTRLGTGLCCMLWNLIAAPRSVQRLHSVI